MVRWLPNFLTLLRVLLLVPFVFAFLSRSYPTAFGVFVVAALTDGLDGWLARRFKWITHWGSLIDPIADKLLVLSGYFLLMRQAVISGMFFTTVLAREIIVLFGAILYYSWINRKQMTPTMLGKLCTLCHFLFLALLLLALAGLSIPDWFVSGGTFFIYVITIASGFQYVLIWGMCAYRARF